MPRNLKPYFISFLFVCLSISLNCQTLSFDKLTTSAGLSDKTVFSIIQDDLGFIWVGTKKGLNRYDGYDFEQFPLPNFQNEGISNPTVLSLLIDNENLIWIGSKEEGLLRYNPRRQKFTRFPFETDATVDWKSITIKSLFEDSRNWLWIATYGGGTIVLNEKREVIFHFCTYCNKEKEQVLSHDFVFDFAEDKNGNVFIATAGRGINVFNPRTGKIRRIHSPDEADMDSFGKSICLDKSETLWVGTEGNGLYSFNIEANEWGVYRADGINGSLSSNIVTDIKVDKNNELWIATDGGGLNRFNKTSKIFKQHKYEASKPNSLNTDALYDLHFDDSGNLWIGTFNGGLNILKAISSPFFEDRQYGEDRKKGLRSVLTIEESLDGKVWLGTDGGGLFYFEVNAEKINLQNANQLLKNGVFHEVITCIEPADNQGFWYGSFTNGLNFFDSNTKEIKQFLQEEGNPESLSDNNVWDLETDEKGGLWIGTLSNGIDYLPKGESKFQHFGDFDGQLSGIQIIDILLDHTKEFLWVATENNGLNRIDLKTQKISLFQHQYGKTNCLQSNTLEALFEDKAGFIWIISNNGLDKLNPKTDEIENMVFNHPFPLGTINSIEEDDNSFIWLSTSTGFHRLDPKDQTIVDFGPEPALKDNVYNPKAAHQLSDGRIVFGGINGFSIILPDRLMLNNNEARPVFTDLKIANQTIAVGKHKGRTILDKHLNDPSVSVQLSYQDKGIAFLFSSTEFTKSSLNKYAYKLEGFDEDWNYVSTTHPSAFYPSLRGGNYKLKIKATNSSGVWNEQTRSINITVKPPFWETAWFLILVSLIAITSIIGGNRILLNRQKKKNELMVLEKEQEILKQEQEILQLKNKSLEGEVSNKKAELNATILQVAHKNEFLTVLKTRIKKIKSEADESAAKPLRAVINIINTELKEDNYWEQFQLVFNQTFKDFITEVEVKHPNITANDLRLCCCIKMKLSNKEIASILNINFRAVEQAKYRLKKKILLDKSVQLKDYIQTFGD